MGAQQSRQMLEAASAGDVHQMSQLLNSVPVDSTDDDGWTALHFSSWAGRAPIVKKLLDHEANVRARDKRGRMPIHLAALRGQTDVIALLCDHGSPLDDTDADGTAPLHKALGQGHLEAVQHLLAYGADAKQSLQDGTTPLHLAAYSGKAEAVQLLIRSGASVHAQNCDGQTPLFEAAAAGHCEAAKVLVHYGADAGHRDREGLTAADRAPPQLASILHEPGLELETHAPSGQAPSPQRPGSLPQGRGAKQGGFVSRLWDGLPSLSHPSSSAPPVWGSQHQPSEHDPREQHFESAHAPIASLPSAPPLPESQAQALHAAAPSHFLELGSAQDSFYPSLHASSTHTATGLRPIQSQNRQRQGGNQQRHGAASMEGQAGEGTLGFGAGLSGQEGGSAEVRPAGQPAGSLAWAMQAAAGASSAAASALSAWLPWQANSSASSAPQQEQQRTPQAAVQAALSVRRYGLQPGNDSEEDQGEQSAVDCLADNLQRKPISGCEVPAFRVFRQQELFEATDGFSEAANRLDRAGSPNSAFLGVLPAASLDVAQHTGGMQVVMRGYSDIPHGQARLDDSAATTMAEAKHPSLLPLIGVCPDSGSAVYGLMENGSLDDALHGRRPRLAKAPVRLDWVSRTRVAAEVASALMHLHSLQPSGFAHGRLRPSCILLDRDCSAHVSDAAIHAIFGQPQACDQAADVFALGLIMLQLLTGSEPHGLAQHAAEVVRAEGVARLVDPCAGDWPLQAASEFCSLAIKCSALRAEERPILSMEVLPALSRLVGRAEGAAAASSKAAAAHNADPPAFLLCPITQELFDDPVVCADGYTYSRAAIAQWLQSGHSTSPMTNLRLSSRELRPNYTLRSAAMEWQDAREAQQQ